MTRFRHPASLALLLALLVAPWLHAAEDESPLSAGTFSGMELRNIGPAFMSGRIADIALHPDDHSVWYVAVGSGGVWKTVNAGTTWQPIFDGQDSYSIGAITLDPSNPNTVWVGTGENVGGRHVGYGDGIYRSDDGGSTWRNVGLEASEHISKIIVHPDDPDTVWVAAQGPLWSAGGERGVYMTTDGGENWEQVLAAGEWTGATDLLIDPRDPDRLYAALWQHHRTVAAYMGGGPESGIYRSDDGGESWTQLKNGLPDGNLGKIGLAISPQKPDTVYAAIELDRRQGGVWRSTDRGASWQKRSETVSGGTGPHYYQELYASPHAYDRIYLADVRIQVSSDGGTTFGPVPFENKHSDDHAIAFRPDDPEWLMVGSDGGLYVSHDSGANWRFIDNLPITQFYKVAVDDAEPFYNVYGGTQDNNTQGGPARTDNVNGIRNSDWEVILFADGHQPATEPGNPDIVYAEWQQGNLVRIDRTTGEKVYIKPQTPPGEPPDRFNWDAPILVSPHSPTRLYYASQRLWRSDDRGDTWTTVSGDLTRNENRMRLELMDRQWGWNAPWDMFAMSNYNTITSIAESPTEEGLLYVGTDDGLIQVSEDGGESWDEIEVGDLPGVPDGAFVNDIKADLHDADTVYVAIDAHKFGDYAPYLLKSTNRGRSWDSIADDLPERHLVWRVVQDHVDPDLLFAATEFGLFFTVDGGERWTELSGGVPTISFRDLAIQRRENDLVAASFGRGFYVLDDYSPLRGISEDTLDQEAALFAPRDAWWYIPQQPLGGGGKAYQGADFYIAPNPPFGAVVTYYLADALPDPEKAREKADAEARKEWEDNPFPDWETLEAERRTPDPAVVLTIRDDQGNVVRRLDGPTTAGIHRVAWDLRWPAPLAVGGDTGFFGDEPEGLMVAPGTYTAGLAKRVDGQTTQLAGPVEFEVEPMREGALDGAAPAETAAFWREVSDLQRGVSAAGVAVQQATQRLDNLRTALGRSTDEPGDIVNDIEAARQTLHDVANQLQGNASKNAVGEPGAPTVGDRLMHALMGTMMSTYGPTPSHRQSLEWGREAYARVRSRLNRVLTEDLPGLEQALIEAGAPWTPGQPIPPVAAPGR